jgi:ketosteroid isomerase-like protein
MDPQSLTRRLFDTFNRGVVGAFVEECEPDVEIVSLRGLLEDHVYRGPDGVRQFFEDSAAAWSEVRLELLEVESRDDRLLVSGRMRAIGRASGARVERRLAWAARVRNGRALRIAAYETLNSARRELGWEA